jgi:predicted MFS family arabinose efflux permease
MPEAATMKKSEVGIFTTIRIVINAGVRLVYPFLPVISRGMQVDVATIAFAISFSLAASALGPFIAPIADRYSRRTGLLVGLGLFSIGAALVAIFPGYWTFLVALLLINLGDNVILPSVQAYISDRVPYARRGVVIGITELAWALSYIIAIPLIGVLIQYSNWFTPFGVLAGLGLLSIIIVFLRIPLDHPKTDKSARLYAGIKELFTIRNALLILAAGMLMVAANGTITVVYGVWMVDSFNLQIAALGLASMVIGFSELGGETLTTTLSDRIGKERSVMLGLVANCIVIACLPFLRTSMIGALIWLALFYLTFEFGITSSWMVVSEVAPNSRASMIAVYIAALSLAFGIGNFLAPFFYQSGMLANGIAAVVFNLLAILALSRIKFFQ